MNRLIQLSTTAIFMLAFDLTQIASAQAKQGSDIRLKIVAEQTSNGLNEMVTELKQNGIQIEVSNIEYNEEKLLTRIQMSVLLKGEIKRVESYNDGNPIIEPLVFYQLHRPNDQQGLSLGIPEELSKDEQRNFKAFTGLIIGTFKAK